VMGIDDFVPDVKQWSSSRNKGGWSPHQGTDVAAFAQLRTPARLGPGTGSGGRHHAEQQPDCLKKGTCSEQL
jgi:hypothetical protein